VLITAAQELALAPSLLAVQTIVRTTARALARADGATFVLREGDECFYADEDAMSPLWKGQRFPIDVCISGWAMQHRETVVVPDIRTDERIPQDAYRPTFVRSMAMIPVGGGKPVAAIGVYWATPGIASAEGIVEVRSLAALVAMALTRLASGTTDEEPALRS
jgi:putative two-component system response regulator